jgi:hypothetical protein
MDTFLSNREAYPVLMMMVIGICVAGPFVAKYWYKARRSEMELGLKQAMVERGMSAAEICSVIEAGEGSKADEEHETRGQSVSRVKV